MRRSGWIATGLALFLLLTPYIAVGDDATVDGVFTFNGKEVKLPHVYVVAEEKGFYEETDPTWKLIFVDRSVEQHRLDKTIWKAALLELQVTKSAMFNDEPTLQVYSQNIVPAADFGGNLSGGTYPELEVEVFGPDRFVGRVYHKETQKFFDDTYHYDLKFSAVLSDPDAPIGAALPAGGGEPGKAYLKFVEVIHRGDLEALKAMAPAEERAMLDGEEAQATMELLQLLTPQEVKILGGSSDGKTALLQVEGVMDGEKQTGEITVQQEDDRWVVKKSSW